ncbi:MAG: hypothetical protein EKK64_03725 [Neisseriaceae bacterium]|nr:MAG: hypothetical protein EKK64_03725 [Neisseriaceae bacterium]
MAITQTSDLNSLYNQIYERALFVLRETNLMVNLVSNYSANTFYTRNITTRPTLTVETATEAVDYTNAQSFGKTLVGTLTPQERMAQVIITDIELMNDPDPTAADASQEMGAAMAQQIDKDLLAVANSFATDIGSAGSSATIAKVAAGINILQARFANQDGPINVILRPEAWHDIWVLLGQPVTNQAFLGDTANMALRDYYVGNWLGVRWFTSANIAVDSSDDAPNLIFTQSAIAFDSRISPYMENQRDASLRAVEMNLVCAYGVGLGKRPTLGLRYTTDCTTPS